MDKTKVIEIVKDIFLMSLQGSDFRRNVYKLVWDRLHAIGIPEAQLGIVTEMVVVSYAELVTRIEYTFSKE